MNIVSRLLNPVNHVEVYRVGGRYYWRKVYAKGAARSSNESWVEPEAAIQTALDIADAENAPVAMPQWLIDRWEVVQFAGLEVA
jgi:hypothetical protein